MPDTTEILRTIDMLAALSTDVTALRVWLARVHAGHELTARERDAVAWHLRQMRDGTAAVLHGAALCGFAPADDSQDAAGDSRSVV